MVNCVLALEAAGPMSLAGVSHTASATLGGGVGEEGSQPCAWENWRALTTRWVYQTSATCYRNSVSEVYPCGPIQIKFLGELAPH